MMGNQVIHCWQPSKRLLSLMEKKLQDENILAKKLSSPPLDEAIIRDRFKGKIKERAYNGLKRGLTYGEFEGMTWIDFVEETKKPYRESKFYFIREFGEVSFNEVKRVIA